jgi:intein/homing endonuclease
MKTMVITPKSQTEFKFINDLLKKLGISSATMTEEELEDTGLSKMLKAVDKKKKVSRENIMQKLKA